MIEKVLFFFIFLKSILVIVIVIVSTTPLFGCKSAKGVRFRQSMMTEIEKSGIGHHHLHMDLEFRNPLPTPPQKNTIHIFFSFFFSFLNPLYLKSLPFLLLPFPPTPCPPPAQRKKQTNKKKKNPPKFERRGFSCDGFKYQVVNQS